MENKLRFFIVLLLFIGASLLAQFGEEPFADKGDPEIINELKYAEGMIIVKISMGDNFHITDIKEGFFKVEIEDNEYLEIEDVVYPNGVNFSGDKVYKGDFEVKAFVKQKKNFDKEYKISLIVSYQICKEKPAPMCFAPSNQKFDIEIKKGFDKYKIERKIESKKDDKTDKNELIKAKKDAKSRGALSPAMLLILSLFMIAFAVFFGLFTPYDDDDVKMKLKKALLILIMIGGAFLFVKYLENGNVETNDKIKPENSITLNWVNSIEEGKKLALKEHKKIMIDTYADWCVACKELDEFTFSSPEVAKVLKKEYILVKVDFTRENETNNRLRKELGVIGMPTVIFLNEEGKEFKRFSGYYNKERFLGFIGSKIGFFDRMVRLLKKELDKKSIILFFLIFGLGFLTSLTPCVYPVIPIVMGYIGTKSGGRKLKGFYLSIFFVLGLATVYSILGVIAGATGSMMGVSFQNPVIVIVIAMIFIIMGLSMAGLFDIPVPSSISSKMQGGGKGEIIGSMVVGGVAGVIAAPCVGPVLIALLSWISQTGNIFLGFLLTFVFSLGMGVIFLLVGTFSGLVSALPKGGSWMENVKYFFAAILIAGGIYVLNPVVPAWVITLLWGVYLIALSVFLGVLKILVESNLKEKLGRLIVLLILIYGLFLFFSAADEGYSSKNNTETKIETGWLKK